MEEERRNTEWMGAIHSDSYRRVRRIESATRITLISVAVILALTGVAFLGVVFWRVLSIYIDPQTATERKDLVQSFAVVLAGAVGSLSALAAVGNLYVSRRNLQQQRELEAQRAERERELEQQRAQEDAVPEYIEQMIRMLSDKERPLRQSREDAEVRILARVRTLTALARLDGLRKAQVVQFLYESGLISKRSAAVNLTSADLRDADLRGADLSEAYLSKGARPGSLIALETANVISLVSGKWEAERRADERRDAELSGADLSGADLSETTLTGALVTQQQLDQAASLKGATMPNGQKYEDWRKDREDSKND